MALSIFVSNKIEEPEMQTKDYAKAICTGIARGAGIVLIGVTVLAVSLALVGATIHWPWK